MRIKTPLVLMAMTIVGCTSPPDPAENDSTNNGTNVATNNGTTNNGATNNGTTNNGSTNNAETNNGSTDNAETNNASNGETNNNSNNNTNDGPNCDDCRLGETRCSTNDDGQESYEICSQDHDGEGPDCTNWARTEKCIGNQTCEAANGCVCPTTCALDGQVSCEPDGVFVCVMIDGCPQSINIERNDECDPPMPPEIDCDGDPTNPYCQQCQDGRACAEVCPGRYACRQPAP